MEGDSLKHYPELHCQGLWLGLWWRRSPAARAIYQSTFGIRIYKMSACLYLVCLRSVFWLPLWLELLWGSSSVTPALTGEGWGLAAFRFLSSKKLFLSWGPAGCGGEQVLWTRGDPRTLNKSIQFQFQLCMLHLWGNVCTLKDFRRYQKQLRVGFCCAQVVAEDVDSKPNGAVFYSIITGNQGNQFSIDPTSGIIRVNKELDRETVSI